MTRMRLAGISPIPSGSFDRRCGADGYPRTTAGAGKGATAMYGSVRSEPGRVTNQVVETETSLTYGEGAHPRAGVFSVGALPRTVTPGDFLSACCFPKS